MLTESLMLLGYRPRWSTSALPFHRTLKPAAPCDVKWTGFPCRGASPNFSFLPPILPPSPPCLGDPRSCGVYTPLGTEDRTHFSACSPTLGTSAVVGTCMSLLHSRRRSQPSLSPAEGVLDSELYIFVLSALELRSKSQTKEISVSAPLTPQCRGGDSHASSLVSRPGLSGVRGPGFSL